MKNKKIDSLKVERKNKQMTIEEYRLELKKLAVVLYEQFKGNQNDIMKELLENNLKLTPEIVNERVKEYNIDDYVLMGEDEYADILKDIESNNEVIYVYKKVLKH